MSTSVNDCVWLTVVPSAFWRFRIVKRSVACARRQRLCQRVITSMLTHPNPSLESCEYWIVGGPSHAGREDDRVNRNRVFLFTSNLPKSNRHGIMEETLPPKLSMKYLKKLEVRFVEGSFKNPLRGQVRGPEQIYEIFRDLKDEAKETLVGVYLSRDLELNSYEVLTIGTASMSLVAPDEVFRSAILTNSPYIILIHNHPSGIAAPSAEDRDVIALLTDQALVMRRRFLDFIIVGEEGFWSWFEAMDGGEYSLGAVA